MDVEQVKILTDAGGDYVIINKRDMTDDMVLWNEEAHAKKWEKNEVIAKAAAKPGAKKKA